MQPVKKVREIARNQKWITICLGFILGFFILYGSFNKPEQEVAQNDQDDQEQVTLAETSYEALPSVSQDTVERNSFLIEELPDFNLEEAVVGAYDYLVPSVTKIFEVVFENIISPNSP